MRKVCEIISFLNALKFVILCKYKPIRRSYRYTQIRVGSYYRHAHVYVPTRWYSGKEKGTIVVIHGMSALANEDPRIIAVCEALAQCGYLVVAPKFSEIAQFWISAKSITNIAQTLRAIAFDKLLCRFGKISVFAPSFSAGMTLIAISQLEQEGIVEALCCIGAFGCVNTVMNELLNGTDVDEYGRLIVLKNVIRYAAGFGEKTVNILQEAILDNGLKREKPKFASAISSLPHSQKRRILRLLNDVDFRMKVWNKILSQSPQLQDLMHKLSVIENISAFNVENDNVISPKESKLLFEKLHSLQIPSRLCITPLISHGDAQKTKDFWGIFLSLCVHLRFFREFAKCHFFRLIIPYIT